MMTISAESIDTLEDQRTVTQQFFDDEKLDVDQIITVNTQTLPARVIAYQYYGESESGQRIAILNDEINSSFLTGDIEIFTA